MANRERREGESYEDYKESLKLDEKGINDHLMGLWLYNAGITHDRLVHGEMKTVRKPAERIEDDDGRFVRYE